jgi:hypothetical protein
MGYNDLSGRMANSYSISKRTWKWMKELYSKIIHCVQVMWGNMIYLKFREWQVRDLIVLSHEQNTKVCSDPRG